MYDYPEPPPGRISLIICGILKAIFGLFFSFIVVSFSKGDPLTGLMLAIYGSEVVVGAFGICFAKAETIGKCAALLVLGGVQLALYLISGFGGGFANPVLLIALALCIWFEISALRNLSHARELERERSQQSQ